MLEIKNLTKIYQTKNVTTKALDNVSLQFPSTGMVFLLGKSGSGKSTLLNVCGGLDTPTEGEIIVKGRSSTTFSNGDFDSYRNTYIGFIFQEYNILNEFSVEDNIALALELQGKSKDREKILELLKEVELEKYAKRKPNTLSGGQKQRIAIARALIKNPEIIMADEPTGALDSNTGKQVLDTLKKLSKTKLVIVVSHDREFAEFYGDRIIELKDGQVISDITKAQVETKCIGNIKMIDDNTISIDKGTELTSDDLHLLNDFLKSTDKELLISCNQNEISKFKKQANISEDGSKETFIQTNEDNYPKKEYTKEDARFLKAKLPLKHAVRIGTSSLKIKPFRLLFTILLSIVSFVLLGIVSTMTFYDKREVAIESIINSEMDYLPIQKAYEMERVYNYDSYEYSYKSTYTTMFSDNDIERINSIYGDDVVYYFNFKTNNYLGESIIIEEFEITNSQSTYDSYYSSKLNNFAYINQSHSLRDLIICGDYPDASNEIMITSYLFDSLKANGLKNSLGNKIVLNNPIDIVGKSIIASIYGIECEYIVSGVYDIDDFIPQKYKKLADNTNDDPYNMNLYSWERERKNGIYSLCLVSESFYDDNKSLFSTGSQNINTSVDAFIELSNLTDYSFYSISTFNNHNVYSLTGSELTSHSDNSIAITVETLSSLYESWLEGMDEEFLNNFYTNYEEVYNTFKLGVKCEIIDGVGNEVPCSNEERVEAWVQLYNFLVANNGTDIFSNISMNQPDYAGNTNVNIVGFVFASDWTIVMSDSLYTKYNSNSNKYDGTISTKYEIDLNAKYIGALVLNSRKYADVSRLIDSIYNASFDDSKIVLNNSIIDSIDNVSEMIDLLSVVFLWAGIVMALFATLLLFNFISVSISSKKREIGILRAIGTRSIDVFKIFFSESFVIVSISSICAVILSMIACGWINSEMGDGLSGVQVLVFGIPSVLLIIGISLVVSIVSTFLPVYSIAKKKPVESIRAL